MFWLILKALISAAVIVAVAVVSGRVLRLGLPEPSIRRPKTRDVFRTTRRFNLEISRVANLSQLRRPTRASKS